MANVEAMPPALDSNPVSSWVHSTVDLPQDPGVVITKTFLEKSVEHGLDQTMADAGDTLTYTMTVENVGNTWLSNVTVLDPHIKNTTCSPDFSSMASRFVVGTGNVVCIGSVSVDQGMVNAGFFESESRVRAQPLVRLTLFTYAS